MLQATGTEEKGRLSSKSISNFPCSDLRIIDQLWDNYSKGRFGFSVQKRIWENVGQNYDKFGDYVGWKKGWWTTTNQKWITCQELTFDTTAKKGHLPFWDVFDMLLIPGMMRFGYGLYRGTWYRFFGDFTISGENESCRILDRLAKCNRVWEVKGKQPQTTVKVISRLSDDLSSDRNVDYTQLRDLLAAQEWEEADKETHSVMPLAVYRMENEGIRKDDILNFPCTDLRTIDRLWVQYSHERFGFSVQKKIYLEVGGVPDGKFDEEAWKNFSDRVGWRVNQTWIDYGELTFDTIAPEGHLPQLYVTRMAKEPLEEWKRLFRSAVAATHQPLRSAFLGNVAWFNFLNISSRLETCKL